VREDSILIDKKDYKAAEAIKHALEELQRKDKKSRSNCANNKNKPEEDEDYY